MIKIIRERLNLIIIAVVWVVVIAFIGTIFLVWGRGGTDGRDSNFAAIVNGGTITIDEYQQAYRNTYNLYHQAYQDKFTDEFIKKLNLRKIVLDGLIEKRLWLTTASEMGISISNEELRDYITKEKAFYKDDRFDPELYNRFLRANRISTKDFESALRQDLLVERIKKIVRDSAALMEEEINGRKALKPEQIDNLLYLKRERALMAYMESLKKRANIKINEDML